MSSTYTILGEGKKTAVLFDKGDGTHRQVTSLEHESARELAHTLTMAYEEIPSRLYEVAVAYDGKPANARRHLLNLFDAVLANPPAPAGDCWRLSADRVSQVAQVVTGQPDAVRSAVRRELADTILADLDGILVAGILEAEAYRPSYLRLVVNQAMVEWTTSGEQTFNPFFDGLDDEALSLAQANDRYGIPAGYHIADDTWMVLDALREVGSGHHRDYGEASAKTIFAESTDQTPVLLVNPAHLRSWMEANQPDLLEAYPAVGR